MRGERLRPDVFEGFKAWVAEEGRERVAEAVCISSRTMSRIFAGSVVTKPTIALIEELLEERRAARAATQSEGVVL